MNVLTATLGTVGLPLAGEQQVGSLGYEAAYSDDSRADLPRATRVLMAPVRTLALQLVLGEDGDTTADVAATVSDINAALAVANTLVLDCDDGTSAEFNTFPSPPLPADWTYLLRHSATLKVPCEVRVEPYALGDTATAGPTATDLPAAVDLSAMLGEYPTPLTVDVDSGAGADVHSCWLGVSPDPDFTDWLVEAESADLTGWDGDTVQSNAYPTGGANNCVAITFGGSEDEATYDTVGFPEGSYLLLARCKCGSGATLTMRTEWTEAVTSTRTEWHWLPVGEVAMPTRRTRGSGTAPLSIYAACTVANSYIDRLVFLPLSWGFGAYHDADTDTAAAGKVHFEWEHTYVDDVVDYANVQGGGLKALGGQLIVVAEAAAPAAALYTANLTWSYRPRRNWLG